MATQHLAAGLFFQEREKRHLPRNDHTKPLLVALSRQNVTIYVKVITRVFFFFG